MTSHILCNAQQILTILSKSTRLPPLLLVYSVGRLEVASTVAEEANFEWSGKITGKICLKSDKEKELCHQHPIIQRVT